MLDEIIKLLPSFNPHSNLAPKDWLQYKKLFIQEPNLEMRKQFIQELHEHTGVDQSLIEKFFLLGQSKKAGITLRAILIQEQGNTLKINQFLHRPALQSLYMEHFCLSKSQINTLISRFEKARLTNLCVLGELSLILYLRYNELIAQLTKSQPPREAKRKASPTKDETPHKKIRFYRHTNDQGETRLVYQRKIYDPELEETLRTLGIDIEDKLIPGPPVPGYNAKMISQTPNGTLLRKVFSAQEGIINKTLTPFATAENKGRFPINDISEDQIKKQLPNLIYDRASSVQFTATKLQMDDRKYIKRHSPRTTIHASAADIFRANDIEVEPSGSKLLHWSHLIAHFLADERDIVSSAKSKKITNLVPTTAAANYNTLEIVELFIKEQLVNEKTDQIHIEVIPTFTDESLIPDVLIYELNWNEVINEILTPCNEIFYISARSQLRITHMLHQAIDAIRGARQHVFFRAPPPSPPKFGFSDSQSFTM